MNAPGGPRETSLDTIAHAALHLGRILLVNGSDSEQAHVLMSRFTAAFGVEMHVLVSYEAVLITLVSGARVHTKIGYRLPGAGVGMAAIEAANHLVDAACAGRVRPDEAETALEAIEHQPPTYSRWLVVAALGVTAASLARLFDGDWFACLSAGIAALIGTSVRLEFGRRQVNPIVSVFVVALLSGVVGGVAVRLTGSATPALALVAPAMILVPGVPLINGIQDMLRNHMTIGLSRLGFASLVVLAVALGVFVATRATGVGVPVAAPTLTIGVSQDAVFSALAAGGYAMLFGVRMRMAWACAACGVASHTLRTLLFHSGIDLITGTLAGALAAGVLAQVFARQFRAPAVAFAFPGVVAMVPGAYAFRAVFGSLKIAEATADPATVTGSLSLLATVVLMVGAIAMGVALPTLALPVRPTAR